MSLADERIVPCEACGSEGRILVERWGDEYGYSCPYCDGTGSEIIFTQPIELEDLEEFVS